VEVIEVNSDPGPDGVRFPRSFVYLGQEFQIDSIGRRWQADGGEHVLVMIQPNDRVFELLHAGGFGTWYAVSVQPPKPKKEAGHCPASFFNVGGFGRGTIWCVPLWAF
jgi:hypothetical protein